MISTNSDSYPSRTEELMSKRNQISDTPAEIPNTAQFDQILFQLSDEQWQLFNNFLPGTKAANIRLRYLFQKKAPWE
jgi:hypothetical protein